MPARKAELAQVAAELEEMLAKLRASVDALNAIISGNGGQRDG